MNWLRFLNVDYWQNQELERLQKKVAITDESRHEQQEYLDAKLQQLEGDLARVTLFCWSLVEIGTRKGIFTREEIDSISKEIDALDGRVDGGLDPAALPGNETPRAKMPMVNTFAFLEGLKQERIIGPEDYIAEIQRKAETASE